MDGCWEKTHTHTHSKECTYIYTSRFIIDVVAGKWSHYDAGVSEFISEGSYTRYVFQKE